MSMEIPRTGILYLVYRLANDEGFYERFKRMSEDQQLAVLDAAGVDTTQVTTPVCKGTGSQEEYQALYEELEGFTDFNAQFDSQKHGDIIDSLGAFIHPTPNPNPNPPPTP